ncbi:MAG: rhodanese-like domain-containing protein, partial [Coraliomargarita sp.]
QEQIRNKDLKICRELFSNENPRVIVVYCSSESCSTSREVAEQLRLELPDAEIYSLKGGWNE